MSNLLEQDEFANKLEPPPEARQLGPPTGPSILKNPISSQTSYSPSHERSSEEINRQQEPPRKMSVDSISFAPLPQRPSSMPRRNSITLGVAARSSFFNGGGNNVHKNPDGSMIKTFTAEEWRQLENSQGRNVVDLGDVAVDAGRKIVRLFRGRRGSKDKASDKGKETQTNVGKDEKKLEDVGEEEHEEEYQEDAEMDSSVGTVSPNTSQSHISQATTDTSYTTTPPPEALRMRVSYNDLHPYKRSSEHEDEHLKQYALGFDPARLSAKRQQL